MSINYTIIFYFILRNKSIPVHIETITKLKIS